MTQESAHLWLNNSTTQTSSVNTMAYVSQDAFPNVWRALGLSVAAGYDGLGSFAAFMPITCATTHGLRPKNNSSEGDKYVKDAMVWVGVRDISIGVALIGLYLQE